MHGLQAYAVVAAFCIYAQCGEDAAKRGGWRPHIKSHGNYIVDHGKSWKNQEIVFSNFCWNPQIRGQLRFGIVQLNELKLYLHMTSQCLFIL